MRSWSRTGGGEQRQVGRKARDLCRSLYNLNTAGGHMAINFDSGRYAVKHAKEHYL